MTQNAPDLARLRIDRAAPASPSGRGDWLAVLGLAGAVLVVLALVRGYHAYAGRELEVTVARVERSAGATLVSGVAANGYVVARRRAALSTDVQGRVVEIRVEEGDTVRQGDLIARLDTEGLEASLARTRSELRRARAAADLARITERRMSALHATGHAPEADRDAARSALVEAMAEAEALEAAVREIATLIRKSSVVAPFPGVIIQKNAEVGEVVSSVGAGGGLNARGSVATLVDFDTLEVQIELAQTSLQAAREGAPVLIYLDAYPEKGYRGRVRQIWPTADRQKASVEVRAEFVERDPKILPDMGARVVFTDDAVAEAPVSRVLVPARALAGGAEPHVFLFRGDDEAGGGTVARRPVRSAGPGTAGSVVVLSGLEGGELVVLDPPPGLRDGQRVRRREGREG